MEILRYGQSIQVLLMTRYIQFLAPPGSGKSTIAHALVTWFSLKGIHCEYLPEYAKSLVYKGTLAGTNQFLLSGNQYQLLKELSGKVDLVITDTHILNGLIYSSLPKYRDSLTQEQKVRLRNQLVEYNQNLPGITINVVPQLDKYVQEGRVELQEEIEEIQRLINEVIPEITYVYNFTNRALEFLPFNEQVVSLGESISSFVN
jgi:tRNA uridine 5-carbamoylmethylation protein Kti12